MLRLLRQVNKVHHDLRPDLFNLASKYTAEELHAIFTDEGTRVFVCEEHGTVLGYIFTILYDHGGDNMLVPVKELYIDDLCVDEAARGKGVATKLFKYVRPMRAKQAAIIQRHPQRLGRQRQRAGVLSQDGHDAAENQAGNHCLMRNF